MGHMKNIYMETIQEIEGLTSEELKVLIAQKNQALQGEWQATKELEDVELEGILMEQNLQLRAKTTMYNDKLLHQILSIPTYTKHEDLVRDFLVAYGTTKNYLVQVDPKGNVYFTKGTIPEGEYFPCVSAHMDTVFDEHQILIDNGLVKTILEVDGIITAQDPLTGEQTGIGADDLAGVFACLKTLDRIDAIKAAFFVEEECGTHGSYDCDHNFFANVGYFLQYDNPYGYWYSVRFCGTKLYTDEFDAIVKPINEKNGVTYYCEYDSFSDALPIREQFNICAVDLPIGYYEWHSAKEYLKVTEVFAGIELGIKYIQALGNKKYSIEAVVEEKEERFVADDLDQDFVRYGWDYDYGYGYKYDY